MSSQRQNDSMDTAYKILYYVKKKYDCKVIGVPKTVDNDLAPTDHLFRFW